MRHPPTRNGGAGHHPDTAAAKKIPAPTKKLDRPQDTHTDRHRGPVKVWATAYGPSPGRRMWVYSVDCPQGHGVHLHRGGPPRPEGHLRTAKCGQSYQIIARTVLPSPRAAA